MRKYISEKDLNYLAKKVTLPEIITDIKRLPQREQIKLREDINELNDYILMEYSDYYDRVIDSLKYGVPQGIENFMEHLRDQIWGG